MEAIHVVRAASFLADHATDPVRLGDVADHVGYSPFHLARSFERHVGMPPGRFLAAHRFQLAKQLLLAGDDRVIDVCAAVGFSAPGTFATKFTEFVGASPTAFRRLPHVLAAAPPRPVVVPGRARDGGVVAGRVSLTAAAAALVGPAPFVYVGLFRRRAARGFPVSGALLAEPGAFFLEGVPAGTYFVLASAVPRAADVGEQLLPARTVAGRSAVPVRMQAPAPGLGPGEGRTMGPAGLPARLPAAHRRDVVLDALPPWSPPVLVALPSLASPATLGWQDRR